MIRPTFLKIISTLFLISNCLWFTNSSAIFTKNIEEWYDVHQNIYFFSDIHTRCNDPEMAKKQQDELIEFAEKYDALLIIEDSSELMKEKLGPDYLDCSIRTPLNFLHQRLLEGHISYVNVEFRIFEMFYDAMLKLLTKNPQLFEVCKTGELNEWLEGGRSKMIEEFKQALQEHESYMQSDNHPALKINYAAALKFIIEEIKKNIGTETISDIAFPKDEKTAAEFLETIFWCNVRLVDNRILHAIYNNKDKKNIFICAGGAHTKYVSWLMKYLGFRKSPSILPEKEVSFEGEKIKAESAVNIKEFFETSESSYRRYYSQLWGRYWMGYLNSISKK